jgi:alkylation response protein AidB-like acyl-CoA dehydrogenase
VDRSLQPRTEAGGRFVALCEEHAIAFAGRAGAHDRDGTFPVENVDDMKASGAMAACVPDALGGLGVRSLHDLAAGLNRLGRADGSTAIAVAMHLSATFNSARSWYEATAAGKSETAERVAFSLRMVASDGLVLCLLGTEPGAMSFYCETELTPAEGGFRLNGSKTFSTLSPVADVLLVLARVRRPDGDRLVLAPVLAGSAGIEPRDDWDALGMRASGSQSIAFRDVFVAAGSEIDAGPWGGPSANGLVGQSTGAHTLSAAFLGIAEAAHAVAVEIVRTRRKTPSTGPLAERAAVQRVVAENEIDLVTCRATLERSAALADSVVFERDGALPPIEELHHVMAEAQAMKMHVQLRSIEIVDRALTLSGGSGYMSASPLSRYYRDVRAGPFMQQYSPIEAYEYIGKVALGLDPRLDL